jgi:hypothetical protein
VDEKLKEIREDIALRCEIEFLEIGTDEDHVHFFVQAVPMYSPQKIVRIIKSITAREIFKQMPEVKKQLWGGQFRSDGYARLDGRRPKRSARPAADQRDRRLARALRRRPNTCAAATRRLA